MSGHAAQTCIPFRGRESRSRQHEAVFTTGGRLLDREVFPRLAFYVDALGAKVLAIEQIAKDAARRSTGGKQCNAFAAKAMQHPRNVDSATARIALRDFASQLVCVDDAVDSRR